MNEHEIHQRISDLIAEEHRLRAALQAGELSAAEEHTQLQEAERALDQSWDLLRQRQARRDAGQDPDTAEARPADEVGGYRQ
ncbi:MAG: DUF2630 family protein [Janthinobacterium lividum]